MSPITNEVKIIMQFLKCFHLFEGKEGMKSSHTSFDTVCAQIYHQLTFIFPPLKDALTNTCLLPDFTFSDHFDGEDLSNWTLKQDKQYIHSD